MEVVECRSVIRFLYLKGRTPKETGDRIKEVYGDDALSSDVVKHWYHQFRCSWASVETASILGQSHSVIDGATIHKVEAAILEDHRITIRQLAQEVKISVGSVKKIIHDLPMRKLSAR
ncbi:protein GVQW3-like [Octopus sinensis]|uniref:Protein GVQW3-like n=1 Tax=Octopus sinensis TaxID=2607531 RepID=A0A6P7SNV6_9MOLL|nr:protein GVQW3-like [Octopus sinensis]XP_029639743.1 protein GVQW3-like [Octopus sinensis]